MNIKIISKKDITPSIWDGGKTYEYLISPADSSYSSRDFDFRISSASIEKIPSNFTNFEGYHRYLVMLDNDLKINRNAVDESYSKNEIFEFNSEDSVQSFSLGNDFNLMVQKGGSSFDLKARMLNGAYKSKFMFVFAIQETKLKINQQEVMLNSNDLLFIDNERNADVACFSDQEVIIGMLSFK